jgi:hypothetical protein
MAQSCASLLSLVTMAGALALGGCVDMFTAEPPPDASRWHGVTSAGATDNPECGPFAFDLGLYQQPVYLYQTLSGRAYPTTVPTTTTAKLIDDASQWWLDGYMTADNFVEFESRLQRPVYLGARPYSLWRGGRAGDRMLLVESGSPCNREVVLTRG